MSGAWANLAPAVVWVGLMLVGGVALWLARVHSRIVVLLGAMPVAVLTVTLVGFVQIVAPIKFTWVTVALAAWVVGLLVGSVRRMLARLRVLEPSVTPPGEGLSPVADPWLVTALLLALSAGLAGLVMWSAGGGRWDVASQTWDAFFDANVIRAAADSQVLNPTLTSDFAYRVPIGSYYPSTFHGVGVLVIQATGCNAVVASNVVAGLVAGGLWPATAALSARYVLGQGAVIPALVLAWGFHGMPWAPLGWGVLWATGVAGAAVPLVIATFAGMCGLTRVPRARLLGAMGFLASMVALAALHPRIAFLLGALLLLPWLWVVLGNSRRDWTAGRHGRAGVLAMLALAPLAGLAVVSLKVGRSGTDLVARAWPILEGRVAEVLRYVVNGPAQSVPQLLSAVLVAVGLVVAVRTRRLRWLAILGVSAAALDVITATTNYVRPFNALARFWYNDRHRTLVVPPAAAVLLAVIGWERLRDLVVHRAAVRRQWIPRLGAILASLTMLWGALAGLTYLRGTYIDAANDPKVSFVSPDDITFYRDVAKIVPATDRVLNNAWDGSGLLYAYTGIRPVFFLLHGPASTVNGSLLRESLSMMSREEACPLLQNDGIRWVIDGGRVSDSNPDLPPQEAPGIKFSQDSWAVTPVIVRGDRRLYQITGCDGKSS